MEKVRKLEKRLHEEMVSHETTRADASRARADLQRRYEALQRRQKRNDALIADREESIVAAHSALRQGIEERAEVEKQIRIDQRKQQVIFSILKISLESAPFRDRLQTILDLILSTLWFSQQTKGSIFLTDPDGGGLTMWASRGLADALTERCRKLAMGECLCGMAARTGRLVFKNRVDEAHTVTYAEMEPHGHYCMPIVSGPTGYGVLNIYVDQGHLSRPAEVEFLEAIANALAGVIRRRLAEEEAARLSQAVHQSASSILITNRRGEIEFVNARFSDMTGYRPIDVIGRTPQVLKSDETPDIILEELWETVSAGGEWRGELAYQKKRGAHYWAAVTVSPIRDSDGRITHFLEISEDVTERKRTEEQIERLAHYDTLTGLPNQSFFRVHLRQSVAAARRSGEPLALLFMDLDQFKDINDVLGRQAGDALLVEATRRLKVCTRECDIAARMGGDEFAALLTGLEEVDGAATVAERIVASFQEPFELEGRELFIGSSIGIAVFPEDAVDATAFLKNAGLALTRAKQEGGGRFQFFRGEMEEEIQERKSLENDLRRALHNMDGELWVSYQPLVDPRDHSITGGEALLRWNHPERGQILPGEFIPVAERSNLIIPIGEWVLRQACSHLAAWEKSGYAPISISVNLSPNQFKSQDLLEVVTRVLAETGCPPERLNLEITEGLVMQDTESNLRVLEGLREMGVHLSLDDFGAGYSSLGYLTRFPVNKLKIDRSFVKEIERDPAMSAIVKAVAHMGKALGMTVNAEGVETADQLSVLTGHGVDEIQGFFYSRPVGEAEFSHLLSKGRVPAAPSALPETSVPAARQSRLTV